MKACWPVSAANGCGVLHSSVFSNFGGELVTKIPYYLLTFLDRFLRQIGNLAEKRVKRILSVPQISALMANRVAPMLRT